MLNTCTEICLSACEHNIHVLEDKKKSVSLSGFELPMSALTRKRTADYTKSPYYPSLTHTGI